MLRILCYFVTIYNLPAKKTSLITKEDVKEYDQRNGKYEDIYVMFKIDVVNFDHYYRSGCLLNRIRHVPIN